MTTTPTKRTGYPVIDEILEAIAPPVTTAATVTDKHFFERLSSDLSPTPDPSAGEWSLSSTEVNAMVKRGIRTGAPTTCIDIPKHYGAIVVFIKPEIAAQIIADHTAVPQLMVALETIAAYPSGYKHSGIITDNPSAGKDREAMIHLARSVLRKLRTTTPPAAEEKQ